MSNFECFALRLEINIVFVVWFLSFSFVWLVLMRKYSDEIKTLLVFCECVLCVCVCLCGICISIFSLACVVLYIECKTRSARWLSVEMYYFFAYLSTAKYRIVLIESKKKEKWMDDSIIIKYKQFPCIHLFVYRQFSI